MLKYLVPEMVFMMANIKCQLDWSAQRAGKTFLDMSAWVFPKEVSISISRLSKEDRPHYSGHHSIHGTEQNKKVEGHICSLPELGHLPSALRHRSSWFLSLWTWTRTYTITPPILGSLD